jgi:hypothetical protein
VIAQVVAGLVAAALFGPAAGVVAIRVFRSRRIIARFTTITLAAR